MTLTSLPAPIAEYLKSIFLPTFTVFEWEQSLITPWLRDHSFSHTISDDIAAYDNLDFVHIPADASYDYRRVRLSVSRIRDYGWLLLTLPLTQTIWYRIEQYLANWTCVFVVPMWNENYNSVVLLRKPGAWTFRKEEVRS